MKWILPRKMLSLVVFASWLMMVNSVDPGSLVLAGIIAIAIPLLTRRFWPDYPRVRSRWALLRLLGIFTYDIIISNIQVARLILGPKKKLTPGFLQIPLEPSHPLVIALFANMISLTPGTVSSNVSGDQKVLLVHMLNLESGKAQEEAQAIKERYETPLREIFA